MEPRSADEVRSWIARRTAAADAYAPVAAATEAHRAVHGCDAYAGGDGPLLAVLAAALRPRRVLEIGTGLGYSALHLATGAGAGAVVDTVEADASHVELARRAVADAGFDGRVRVLHGVDADVLTTSATPYDLVFYDADVPTPPLLDALEAVLAPTGVLITSNLFLGQYVPDHPRLDQGAEVRERLLAAPWTTGFVGTKALSVRR